MVDKSNLYELRSRSAELLHVSDAVALGSSSVVRKLSDHNLFCRLLRIPETSVYYSTKAETILSEGISDSLSRCDISDRILSCREPPSLNVVDLRTPSETVQVCKDISYPVSDGSGDAAGSVGAAERGVLGPREAEPSTSPEGSS